MSLVNLLQVNILNNPSTFFDNFQFEITFEVVSPLDNDLEFKVVYVGSATGPEHDQTLESVMVGPVPVGVSKFILEVCNGLCRHQHQSQRLSPHRISLDLP
jgi:histone chaperone ASF1